MDIAVNEIVIESIKGINDRYTYRVTWSEEDREYVGLCAEFPSLSWLDNTQEAALQGINNVVAEVISDMEASDEKGILEKQNALDKCRCNSHCGR